MREVFFIFRGGLRVRRHFENPITKLNLKFLSRNALVLPYRQRLTANGFRVKVIHERQLKRVTPR
jgi:hypothetical protein